MPERLLVEGGGARGGAEGPTFSLTPSLGKSFCVHSAIVAAACLAEIT